ncbi:CvfB family protein [Pseudohongiella spirulinae]|uniref:GntR family transcriptional regulator n=1 Tax=Pseudohongiella spirulinae TaxID=1249552 RepID=A0A0S2KD84_9GAMM|nr:S1-like domain-containing RNA-binding protein [Pseudohongiella spirulinae]ALO46267.1 GntR family transcriptional regulator [Pseudohongiella spirulinae]
MIQLGKRYTLRVSELSDMGAYVDAGNLGKVLLPRRHLPASLTVGAEISVFLYLDSDDRLIATTRIPLAMVGEFAFLTVVDVNNAGAFLDWGLEKDLLVPYPEQHKPMKVGQSCLVYLYVDRVHGRIVASSKIDKFLDDDRPHRFRAGQAVSLTIANSTDLGYKAIINHSHWGLLHKSDVNQRLSFGQSLRGYIKHVRPDGKIDLSLQSRDDRLDKNAETIMRYLRQQDGFAPLHDKSDPKLIEQTLGMSKAAFKKCIGRLYKDGLIDLSADGIRIL